MMLFRASCSPWAKLWDRFLFSIFFESYYKKKFKHYGNNIRWGKHFERKIIPRSVRLSCPDKIILEDDVQIDENVYLQCHSESDGIIIRKGSRINAHTHILSYDSIEIGEKVLIAPFCMIASGNHRNSQTGPIMNTGMERSGNITIAENSWLGQRAVVLGGTSIGRNSIVGAGAVVKGQFADCSKILGSITKGDR